MKKTPLVISLVLALGLVVAALAGAKIVYDKARLQPLAMTTYPAPDADSPACASLVGALPDTLAGFDRVDLLDPAPAGAAAWVKDSQTRITIRCGVNLPLQYSALADTTSTAGTTWLPIIDPTEGSGLTTLYAVSRAPVVAVTVPKGVAATDVEDQLAGPMRGLDDHRQPFQPAPLVALQSAPPTADSRRDCRDVLSALPKELTGSALYHRAPDEMLSAAGLDPAAATAWTSPGQEPVVVRCGVARPEQFSATSPLQQVNGIPWFEDTVLTNGTTAGRWYAVGRRTWVAVSVPQGIGGGVMITLSEAIADNDPAIDPHEAVHGR